MNDLEKAKQAYKEIFDLFEKYVGVHHLDLYTLCKKRDSVLFALELKDNYGFLVDPKDAYEPNYWKFDEYRFVGWWGQKHRSVVSCSDDGKQPIDELLLSIRFSTGAYIFGDDYPGELFDEFFNELKSYYPKYIDSRNCALYFSMENAGEIFNEFPNIMKKYNERNREDFKKRKAAKLRADLEKLENNGG